MVVKNLGSMTEDDLWELYSVSFSVEEIRIRRCESCVSSCLFLYSLSLKSSLFLRIIFRSPPKENHLWKFDTSRGRAPREKTLSAGIHQFSFGCCFMEVGIACRLCLRVLGPIDICDKTINADPQFVGQCLQKPRNHR